MKRRGHAGNFVGQRVLMVGLGLHGGGVATARWLVQHGATLRIADDKTRTELADSIRQLPKDGRGWTIGRGVKSDVEWADWIVQNPGVPSNHPLIVAAKKLLKPIMNEAGLFLRYANAPVIGVTGTRGKTTTTFLIAHLLRAYHRQTIVAGNIRDVPLLKVVDQLTPRHRAVVELSSFQLEGLAAVKQSPQIAVWTNLLVDHLDRYSSMSAYATAKSQILRYQQSSDVAVLNADSAVIRRMAGLVRGATLWYSVTKPVGTWSVFLKQDWIIEKKFGRVRKVLSLRNFPLGGAHHHHNVLAATAVCLAAGVPVVVLRQAIRTFPPVPHRQELVRTWRSHRWINDTAATSPDGAIAAIDAFPTALFIFGGTDKKLKYTELVKKICKLPGPHIFLPGTASKKILAQLKKKKYHQKTIVVPSMLAAVRTAAALVAPNQDVVLTPGAASFGLFRHEFDRGEQFVRAVKGLR